MRYGNICQNIFLKFGEGSIEADAALTTDDRRAPSRQSMTAAADEWLEAFLDKSEKPASDVYAAGGEAGFSEDQLKRARPRIGAGIKKVGMPAKSIWYMPRDNGSPEGAPIPRQQNTAPSAPTAPSALSRESTQRRESGGSTEKETGAESALSGAAGAPTACKPVNESAVPPAPPSRPAFPRLRAYPFIAPSP